jgi:CRP-like cAMP-binding protein
VNSPDDGPRNRLLAILSPADRSLLQPSLETVPLQTRQILEAPNESIAHIYFVESGLVSIVATSKPHHSIEVAMIGHEGMTGLAVLLGDDRSANELLVQSAGTALRMSTPALLQAIARSRSLGAMLLRYVQVAMVQASQTALANGRGKLDERLARSLLMWHDRIWADELVITHDFLALLLGVRRPSVTDALNRLEGKGLIRANRRLIRIVDRDGLHRAADGFYGIPEADYDRLIGPAGRRPG